MRAVAVMDIPIGDQNSPGSVPLLRVPGAYGNTVEKAKTHASGGAGVVPWRPNDAKCIPQGRCKHGIHGGKNTACREPGCFYRIPAEIGISRAQLRAIRRSLALDQCDVIPGVYQREFVVGGAAHI